ncbi:MAG TPA: Hsp20/alpha crystallin family protein [Chitinophagaceae bacterium]|nr:Hsp20/alpha crystallin family protein [Chitinophagaceae bacterium]
MATKALTRTGETMPTFFDDFLRPWNDWFDNGFLGRTITVPSVNVTESKDDYQLSLAVPGMKKDDFNIDVNGSMITISSEKEESKEEKEKNYNRKEYNYSSFSRSFPLPDEVNKEKIDARYEDGVLKITLPKKEEAKKVVANKHITVR